MSSKGRRITDYLGYFNEPINICLQNTGVQAHGVLQLDGKVKVSEHSECRLDSTVSIRADAAAHRELLLEQGFVRPGATKGIFTVACIFANPSQAANVILGTRASGMVQWFETRTRLMLGDYLERQKSRAMPDDDDDKIWVEGHWRSRDLDLMTLAQPSTRSCLTRLKISAARASKTDPLVGINVSLYAK